VGWVVGGKSFEKKASLPYTDPSLIHFTEWPGSLAAAQPSQNWA